MKNIFNQVHFLVLELFRNELVKTFFESNDIEVTDNCEGAILMRRTSKPEEGCVKITLHHGTCTDIRKWVYWCSNYPPAEQWIPKVWKHKNENQHFLQKWNELAALHNGDSLMNHFYRELSDFNQRCLEYYVEQQNF